MSSETRNSGCSVWENWSGVSIWAHLTSPHSLHHPHPSNFYVYTLALSLTTSTNPSKLLRSPSSFTLLTSTGHPSLITRCGLKDDRPKMIEFIGQLYREDLILAVGQAYEQMTDWQRHRPDVEKLPEQPPPLAKT